jgi:hypothetical protein
MMQAHAAGCDVPPSKLIKVFGSILQPILSINEGPCSLLALWQ